MFRILTLALCVVCNCLVLIDAHESTNTAPWFYWTWLGGPQTIDAVPVIDSPAIPGHPAYDRSRAMHQDDETDMHISSRSHQSASHPGGRDTMVSVLTPQGHNLLLAGYGPDVSNNTGWLGDMWQLIPLASPDPRLAWKFIVGDVLSNSPGLYEGGRQYIGSRSGTSLFPTNLPDVFALFGGFGYAAVPGHRGKLADLWLLNTTSYQLHYIAGPTDVNTTAHYGQLNVPSADNWPGSRVGMVLWPGPIPLDPTREIIVHMFGGWGFAQRAGHPGSLNDLWRLQLTVHCASAECVKADVLWTWIGGPADVFQGGNTSWPTGRYGCGVWTDERHTGDGFLIGGFGVSANGTLGRLADMWQYEYASGIFRYLAGNMSVDAPGVYGELGVESPRNYPPARYEPLTFWWPTIPSGSRRILALFGGSLRSDLWLYNTSGSGEWMWVGGPSTAGVMGNYGTMGVPSRDNWPGSRYGTAHWLSNEVETSVHIDGKGDAATMTVFGGFGLGEQSTANLEVELTMQDAYAGDIGRHNENTVRNSTGCFSDVWILIMEVLQGDRETPLVLKS